MLVLKLSDIQRILHKSLSPNLTLFLNNDKLLCLYARGFYVKVSMQTNKIIFKIPLDIIKVCKNLA